MFQIDDNFTCRHMHQIHIWYPTKNGSLNEIIDSSEFLDFDDPCPRRKVKAKKAKKAKAKKAKAKKVELNPNELKHMFKKTFETLWLTWKCNKKVNQNEYRVLK